MKALKYVFIVVVFITLLYGLYIQYTKQPLKFLIKEHLDTQESQVYGTRGGKVVNNEKALEKFVIGETKKSDATSDKPVNGQHTDNRGGSYIIPVHYGGGPNCQYKFFKGAMKYAIRENATLTEIFFFNHWTAGEDFQGRKFLNETFDINKIKEVLNLITLNQFKDICNGKVDKVIFPGSCATSNTIFSFYTSRIRLFTPVYDVNLPALDQNSHLTRIGKDLVFNVTDKNQCLALFDPDRRCSVEVPDEIVQQVDLHVTRTEEIRSLAMKISTRICDGKPYIAMQWRNRSGEGCAIPEKRCSPSSPLMVNISKIADSTAEGVKQFMTERNIRCVYVAFPPYSSEIIKKLKHANINKIVSREDITSKSYPIKMRDEIRLDNYHVALLEQEICSRSSVFLTAKSTFSDIVKQHSRFENPPLTTIPLRDIVKWKLHNIPVKKRKR